MKQNRVKILLIIAVVAATSLVSSLPTMAQVKRNSITDLIEKNPGYYDEMVRNYFKSGQWAAGKKLLDEGMKEYSYVSALNELMGQYYYHFKLYDKARYHLINALKDDNSNHQARELLVKVEEETKNYSSAIVYVNELLEVSPYSEHLWRKKIALYRYLGNDHEADILLERLRSIYPENERIQKDWNYRMEMKYLQQHKEGDAQAQFGTLRQLIQISPKNPEYYMALSNLLLQYGHDAEAAEIAGEGSVTTNSPSLVEKKVGILAGMNRFDEARAYLASLKHTQYSSLATRLSKDLQMDAARASQMNDPYIQYAKAYDTNHSSEALTFLLNTSISRGYYDDALEYIAETKKQQGNKETPELLYKEYLVNRRLGNVTRANNLLNKLYDMNPDNEEVATELARINNDKAQEFMRYEQYDEAIPLLIKASQDKVDPELRKASMLKLFNCYLMSKQYSDAQQTLDEYNRLFPYNAYRQQKARVYAEQGLPTKALDVLREGCLYGSDSLKSEYANIYEEIATPYIKDLIEQGMLFIADSQIRDAVEICPNSNSILRMGITTSQLLRNEEQAMKYIQIGREEFPDDPLFIIKEAQMCQVQGDDRQAIDIMSPLLETYIGDSTVIGTYVASCQSLAQKYMKKKQYDSAMALVDSALTIWPTHTELLYTKGLIYKDMREYDKAFEYMNMYKPSLAELPAHRRLLNDVLSKTYSNTLEFEYQQARRGTSPSISANAAARYTRRTLRNEYTFELNYLGRDGTADEGASEMVEGGTGVMVGGQLKHHFSKQFNAYGKVGWANKYFPEWTIKGGVSYELPRSWTLNLDGSFRRIQTYEGVFEQRADKYVVLGWLRKFKRLYSASLGISKAYDQFIVSGGVNGFVLTNNFFFSGQAKLQFFPVEGDHSNIFATAGLGTAPENSIIDMSLPSTFDHLNTFVGLGGYYNFNQHLGFSLSGTWYTMYTQNEGQTSGLLETNPSFAITYINMFYVNASVVINF
jgi:tetratricopeptide (TPR) repeat protein